MLLSDWVYFAYGERVNLLKVIGVGGRWCWRELGSWALIQIITMAFKFVIQSSSNMLDRCSIISHEGYAYWIGN